jgi:hypothetical protein
MEILLDFLATIGDILLDLWVNKIVAKFRRKKD